MRPISSKLRSDLQTAKRRYHEALGELNGIVKRKEALEAALKQDTIDLAMFQEEFEVILSAGLEQVRETCDLLGASAENALKRVFGADYEKFEIRPDITGSKNLADIVLHKHYEGETYEGHPFDDNGGGVNDVISAMLKLTTINLMDPPIENAFIPDEITKHVSHEYREEVAEIFKEISHTTRRQIIFTTQDDTVAIAADNLIRL